MKKNMEKENIRISIVIPVYNCEKYLTQCLDSVINQTIEQIEIICVNDGSTDNSTQIISQYLKSDSRIILLNQKNQGPGRARNLGICNAKGKYIAFLDADDFYLEPDALEIMFEACEKNHVKAAGSLRKSIVDGAEKTEQLFQDIFAQNQGTVILDYQNCQMDYDYQSFIFDRKLLADNRIFFKDYKRFQDPPFLVKALYAAKKFAVARVYLYCYRFSRTVSRFDTAKTIDLLKGLKENLVFADEHNLDFLFQNTIDRLEYEYAGIICRNISGNDLNIIKLLLQMNQMICDKFQDSEYILRPLQMLLESAELESTDYGFRILQKVRNEDSICIYGAGKLAKKFLDYLWSSQLIEKVKFIIVSEPDEKDTFIGDIPIVSVQNMKPEAKDQLVLAAVGYVYQKEIVKSLKENGFSHYLVMDDIFLDDL